MDVLGGQATEKKSECRRKSSAATVGQAHDGRTGLAYITQGECRPKRRRQMDERYAKFRVAVRADEAVSTVSNFHRGREPHTFQRSGQTYASPQEAEQAGLNAVAILNAKEEKKSTGGPPSDCQRLSRTGSSPNCGEERPDLAAQADRIVGLPTRQAASPWPRLEGREFASEPG